MTKPKRAFKVTDWAYAHDGPYIYAWVSTEHNGEEYWMKAIVTYEAGRAPTGDERKKLLDEEIERAKQCLTARFAE